MSADSGVVELDEVRVVLESVRYPESKARPGMVESAIDVPVVGVERPACAGSWTDE